MLVFDYERCLLVVGGGGSGGGHRISNFESQIPIQPSNPPRLCAADAAVRMCVSAARKGGPQTIQAENSNQELTTARAGFVCSCVGNETSWSLFSGGLGLKCTNALPSGEKGREDLGRCHTHKHMHTDTDKVKSRR